MLKSPAQKIITAFAVLLFSVCSLLAVQPGDVIINEVYFNTKNETNILEAVELLVVKDKLDLNGLQITDRGVWNKATEDQCTLNDLGQGFLNEVSSGVIVVIYNGGGEDDTDASDFVLRFYAKSSLFCNVAPTTNAFRLNDRGDNLHLLHLGKQIDFLKYRAADFSKQGSGEPGSLNWQNGANGFIEIGKEDENCGFHFLGDKADLNDYPAAWQPYPETYLEKNNLGKPSDGRNAEWVKQLRASSKGKDK